MLKDTLEKVIAQLPDLRNKDGSLVAGAPESPNRSPIRTPFNAMTTTDPANPPDDSAEAKDVRGSELGVAEGSLPVLAVESFLATIENRVLALRQMCDSDWWDKPKAARQYGFAAEELENAANELRAKMESAIQRQPEENTKFSNAVNDSHPQTDPRNGVAL